MNDKEESNKIETQKQDHKGVGDNVIGDKITHNYYSETRQNDKRLEITIKGSLKEVDPESLRQILSLIQKIGGKTIIQDYVDEGSIRFILNGSDEELQKLQELFNSGELEHLLNEIKPENMSQLLIENVRFTEDSEIIQKSQLIENIKNNLVDKKQLREANLRGADLREADLSSANLGSANLVGADLMWADLSSARLVGARLVGARLVGADLGSANLIEADLSSANLMGANLMGAGLSSANLMGAGLSSANLVGTDLSSANLMWANLMWSDLSKANLMWADLREARLRGARLVGADLSSANLRGANVMNAIFSNARGVNDIKDELIERGAIFEDTPEDPSRIKINV